jgi:hypothetical protein
VEQIPAAVAVLVALVDEHADAFARARASADTLIADAQSEPEWRDFAAELVPAMLATLGRTDEAREALSGYTEAATNQEYRRFSRQLTRLLDGAVTLEQLEAASVMETGDARHFGEPATFAEIVDRARAQRSAVDAVRRASDGLARDQQRTMLLDELSQRGLSADPRWIEAKLDTLDPSHEPVGWLEALGSIGRLAKDTVALVRTAGRGETAEDPAWMSPPEQASNPIGRSSGEWVAVDLDAGADDLLARVHAAARRRIGDTVMIDVWLGWEDANPATERRLGVSIGDQRAGLLGPDAKQRFAGVMAAASVRDELPRTAGRLSQRQIDPRYLLEIAVPLSSSSNPVSR